MSSALISAIRAHSSQLNLLPLQATDAQIRAVLFTAKHVVLYELDIDSQQWRREDIEGPLFIAQRAAVPYYAVIILNRRSIDNFRCDLHAAILVEAQDQYLMMQINDTKIVGLWFYETPELEAAGKLVHEILANLQQTNFRPPSPPLTTQPALVTPTQAQPVAPVKSTLQPSGPRHSAVKSKAIVSASPATTDSTKPKKAAPLIHTGKKLHSKAPPAQLDYAPAFDNANERQLQARLNRFIANFQQADDDFSQQHYQARSAQLHPTSHRAQETQHSDANETPAVLSQMFQSASVAGAMPPMPQHATPARATVAAAAPMLSAGELERQLAAKCTNGVAYEADTEGLHPAVQSLFAQPGGAPQSSFALPQPPRGLSRSQYREFLLSLLNRSDCLDHFYRQYQSSGQTRLAFV